MTVLCRVIVKIDPEHEDCLNDGHWAMIEDLIYEIKKIVEEAVRGREYESV